VIRGELKTSPTLASRDGDNNSESDRDRDSENYEIWDMKMTSPHGDILYNSVSGLRIAKQKVEAEGNAFSLQNVRPYVRPEASQDFFVSCSTVYRDEIDAHWPAHLPLRNILNLFERSRSDMLGGPGMLRKFQEEDGIVFVVTAIRGCSLIDEGVVCYPGQKVHTETIAVARRKGMVFECYQTVKDASSSSRIAQGQVNLMLLDAKTRRPTTNVPDRILHRVLQRTEGY
jgi:acyl-CoA thioesterase FadM